MTTANPKVASSLLARPLAKEVASQSAGALVFLSHVGDLSRNSKQGGRTQIGTDAVVPQKGGRQRYQGETQPEERIVAKDSV